MATNRDGQKVYRDGHSNEINGVLLRNRQIHGEFMVMPSFRNKKIQQSWQNPRDACKTKYAVGL